MNSSSAEPVNQTHYIYWPELISGVLIKRYKRFLADVKLDSGEIVTAHCPNSGSMKECSEAGRPVFLSRHDNPKRKLKYTWELIEMQDSMVGVNTNWPNRLVELAIKSSRIEELLDYDTIRPEVKVGQKSRLDLLLTRAGNNPCYVEVKNCTLVKERVASFPDAVTTRGQKHLGELIRLKNAGARCVMFFLVQRMDADSFIPADDIDPEYGKILRSVHSQGVEILVYDVTIDSEKMGIYRQLPFQL